MASTLRFTLLFAVAVTVSCADANLAAEGVDSGPKQPPVDQLVVYERGNMPVIILVPHDGTAKPEGMPLRKRGTRDLFTSELAHSLCSELAYTDRTGVKRRPHLVINLASRAVVEPNLSWEENLRDGWFNHEGERVASPARAECIHRDFHACAAYAVKIVEANHGAGVLLDLHGLSATRSLDMYGYLIPGRGFFSPEDRNQPASNERLAAAVRQRSTMQYAASRKNTDREVADLLRGPHSLASLVDQAYRELAPTLTDADGRPRGRPATPSARFPNPYSEKAPDHKLVYFNGAYDIFAHSSRQNMVRVDAIQVETTADARNSKADRLRFARCMAIALREFLRLHYGLNITDQSKR